MGKVKYSPEMKEQTVKCWTGMALHRGKRVVSYALGKKI